MAYKVALSFEDGVTKFIDCEDGQTVADASYRNRINIPLDCRDGACGTCKSFCESGEFDPGYYVDDALTEDEAEEGYCLPCQMKPKSDLVLQIPSTSAVAKTQTASYTGTITKLDRLSDTVFGVTLDVEGWDKLAFLAGQYVNIAVPGTDETRSYSFANGVEGGEARFLVKNTPGGVMTRYLDERAKVGDTLTITGPNGSFFLRDTARPVLLLAGGTGLAPVMSMLETMAAKSDPRKVHVIYAVNTDEDVVELDKLEEIATKLPGMTWDYVVGDKASTAKLHGYATDHIADEVLHGGDVAVYVCGPPPMVEAVRKHFKDRGVELTGFYFEKFALAGTADESKKAAAEPTAAQLQDADLEGVDTEDGLSVPTPAVTVEAVEGTGTGGSLDSGSWSTPGEILLTDPDARGIARQPIFEVDDDKQPLGQGTLPEDDRRGIARQVIFGTSPMTERNEDAAYVSIGQPSLMSDPDARGIARQVIFGEHELTPLVAPKPRPAAASHASDVGAGGYQIGEEHADIAKSDAVFEAREALELGALELTIGRLTSQQLAGYRLLADATHPYVEGDRFVDAAGYTTSNAAFHDYLFALTGNPHLLEAYQRLGVKNHMDETLKGATWCHPDCIKDHDLIVDAFEAEDRDRARELIMVHAEHSKVTTRRAMNEAAQRSAPAWVSQGRFADQVVVVTGSAQGIGEAVARRIGAEGGSLVLADRSELVDDVAKQITSSGPGAAITVKGDLETYEGAQAVIDAAIAKYGRVDVAIHNVGGAIRFKPFTEFSPDEIDKEISRSLMPTLYGCRAVLPRMVENGGGTIVNVSSIATGGIYRIPYAAAKGGVNAITRALAVEAAEHGVRVVATAPGGTEAPPRKIQRGPGPEGEQEQTWFQAHIDQTLDSALMHRYGTLDEQAAAICFLASREAAYITGSVLPVGGGDLG